MKQPFIIGITGGSGSGKTTLIRQLESKFSDDKVCMLSMDNYYKPRDLQERDGNNEHNFDLPTSFRREDFYGDILKLINGEELILKEYTFNNPDAKAQELVFKPAPVIILEGIFVFYFKEIADLINLKVFVEVKEHLKLIRRIKRDNEERNYPLEDVLYRYENHVYPTFEQYIYPLRDEADIIINNNKHFGYTIDLLTKYIEHLVE